jgi:AcrR family transcriptional regulator
MSSTTVDGRRVRGSATRLKILQAARETLLESGTGGTSTRAVAERAGVPLSLLHYHFGSKHDLLAAVLEHENEVLLARQRELYAAPGPLAEKWRTACAFLDEDIGSGYVRVLWELWAAGLADQALAARWRLAMGGWRELLESVVAAWAEELKVALPLSPRATAALITNLFQGIEVELLAGVREDDAPHREVLDAIGALIERTEASALSG